MTNTSNIDKGLVVIIAGSRGITDYGAVEKAVAASGFKVSKVVSGGARGVDSLAERYAKDRSIPFEEFPADWNKHGKSAGYRRNEQMADNADALIAIWDGESKGTKHMIDIAKRKGLQGFVYDTTDINIGE